MAEKGDLIEVLVKEAKIQYYKPKKRNVGHYFIQIPKEVARELELKEGKKMVFTVPLKDKVNYQVRFK